MKMNDKTYNVLKWIAQIVLPACIVAYGTISGAWGLPYTEPIVVTATAVDTLLGVILGISSSQYNKGVG